MLSNLDEPSTRLYRGIKRIGETRIGLTHCLNEKVSLKKCSWISCLIQLKQTLQLKWLQMKCFQKRFSEMEIRMTKPKPKRQQQAR